VGYKPGQGLGRDGTGIAEAIQTKLRPKNMGMGYNEFQEQARIPSDADVAEPQAPGPGRAPPGAAAPAAAKGSWKRRAKEARQKRVYKTAEELLRESEVRSFMRGGASAAPQFTRQQLAQVDGPRMTVAGHGRGNRSPGLRLDRRANTKLALTRARHSRVGDEP
jgi:hypothetical protein